jgi:hypothetical protein
MNDLQKLDHLLDIQGLSLETLSQMSTSLVYCLVNESQMLAQVFGSTNALMHLGRILDEIKTSGEYKTMKNDLRNLKLVVLETSPESMKISIALWIAKYKSMGYTMYKDVSPIKLSLETRVEYLKGRLRYCLYLVGQGSYNKLVGVFDKKKHLIEFKNAYYEGDRISTVVVHSSTRLYNK